MRLMQLNYLINVISDDIQIRLEFALDKFQTKLTMLKREVTVRKLKRGTCTRSDIKTYLWLL